ncbi:MAG: GAF domain-containing protein, partial [Ignavibacteriales bacterium]|nr:GAF domain-containing protein [Ignavibacteriales bacterium]
MRYTLLKEWYTKNFLGIIYAVSSGIVLLNILTLYAIFTVQRTSNDECLWQPVKQKNNSAPFIFKSVKVNGVTWQAGIRDGDFLLQINDKAIKTSAEAQDIINKIEEGGTVIYKVQRGKEIFKTTVTLKKLVDIGSLSFSLFAAIWFIVGFLVLIAKPDGYLQRLFFLVGVLFSLMRSFPVVMQALPVYGYHPLFIAYFMLIVWCTAIFPLYYYRFFALFPGESQKPLHKYIEITVKILAVLAAGTSYYVYLFPKGIFFLNVENPQLHSLAFVNYLRPAAILTNVAFFVGFIILLTKYIRMKDKQGRKKITLILISYGVGQIGLLFFGTVAPTMGYIVFNSPEYFIPILLVVFLPIAFAVSIFRYNLMDVSTVVKNTILYGTATISLAILYFLIVLGMGNAIGSMVPQIYSNIVSLFFFVLFAIVFQTKKDNFQELLTKQFYPEQFAYRKVLIGFHQNLSQIVGRENILDALMNLIVNVIKVQKAGLLLVQPGNNIYKFERQQNMQFEVSELLIHPEKIVKAVAARKKGKAEAVFGQDNMHELFGANTHHLLEQGVFTVVPLICGKHVPGFLLLGLKRSGSQFGGKDLSLLASVAGQISISLENARLYEAEVQKIELEKELDVARRIQQNLLPKHLPVNPRVDIYG